MRPLLVSLAGLALCSGFCQSPLAATELTEQPAETNEVGEEISNFYSHISARRFDQAIASAKKLETNELTTEGRALVSAMHAVALLGLGRDADAQVRIAEVAKFSPTDPLPIVTLFIGALATERVNVAADAFDTLLNRFPDATRKLDAQLVYHLIRSVPKDQQRRNEDRKITLARIGYGGDLKGDFLAAEAVGILLTRGDSRQAMDLLRYIDEPQIVEDMLIQKRFETLWPEIEARAGKRLELVRRSNVAVAERAYEQAPDVGENLQLLINALRHAGRHDEAIELRNKLPSTPAAMLQAHEDMGWAVNNVSLALHEVGRSDEADALLEMLNGAPMSPGEGRWRVSMIINRLEMLVRSGKFEKALSLLDAAEQSAKNDGNEYARQLVRRLQYCTMSGLGRKDEAAKLLPGLLAHAKDARRATVDGLLCGREIEKAEQLVIDGLRETDAATFEQDVVRSLQPKPLTSDDPSIWDAAWLELRQRPAIAREYFRLGRDMPADYLPSHVKTSASK